MGTRTNQLPSHERASEVGAATMQAYRAEVPLLRAAVAQGAAVLLMLALTAAFPGLVPEAMAWALLQGAIAALLGRALGMEVWWLALHALFVPGLVLSLEWGMQPVHAMCALCLLLSFYWGVPRTRVPLFFSGEGALREITKLLPREGGFSFLDVGSGFGGLLTRLARECPTGYFHGIESAPVPFLQSRLRAAMNGRTFRVRWGDLKDVDLGRYDVVYAYLSPAAMGDLWRKASREMRAGSVLISNGFAIPGVTPDATVATSARHGPGLLFWRM